MVAAKLEEQKRKAVELALRRLRNRKPPFPIHRSVVADTGAASVVSAPEPCLLPKQRPACPCPSRVPCNAVPKCPSARG